MKCHKCKKREATLSHYRYWEEKPLKAKDHKLVAKKNPEWFESVCDFCHANIHGISAKQSELKRLVIMRDRGIRIKNSLENQVRGFGRIEYVVPDYWDSEMKIWKGKIKEIEKQIKAMLDSGDYPVWNWLKEIKGISYNTGAKLISWIDIGNTPTVSALWRYCGLDATHIKRTKKISKEEAKKFGNPYLKKELLGILADSFIKQRTPIYRKIYDDEKERQLNRVDENKPKSQGHAHNRAKRKMMKIFLEHFWINWRELEGLPTKPPYVIANLGHKHYIRPLT